MIERLKYIFLACSCLFLMKLNATVRLPHLFSDHMIIQRDRPVKIWGWAERNETVEVSFDNQIKKTKANRSGSWTLSFDQLSFGGPYTMVIKGENNQITLKDIYIGEVWVCSGQSNMEMPVHGWASVYNYQEEIENAEYPLIRMFNVAKKMDVHPRNDCDGKWMVCSPQSVADFSATAYFYAQKLNKELNMPIGIINASWGGTEIESWIPTDAYQSLPKHFNERYKNIKITDFDSFAKENENNKVLYLAAMESDPGIKEEWYNPLIDVSSWSKMQIPQFWESIIGNVDGIVWFRRAFILPVGEEKHHAVIHLGPIDDDDVVWINGKKVGETHGYATKRIYDIPPGLLKKGENTVVVKVSDYSGGGGIYGNANELYIKTSEGNYPLSGEWLYKPSVTNKKFNYVDVSPNMYYGLLYNAMINPLISFPVKGVVWYQGESNVGRANDYNVLFPTMINAWRAKWEDELPFYWVQLANYGAKDAMPQKSEWAELREAQAMALVLPQTGQAVITDIGDADDLHPRNKQEVGLRLALIALNKSYGIKDVVCSGPIFKSMNIVGNKMYIEYDQIGKGLLVKNKYGYIEGFAVAGADRRFEWAKAYLDGNKIVVFADNIAHPVAVRYSWSDNPDVNLFNENGLPAVPFRTDDWNDARNEHLE